MEDFSDCGEDCGEDAFFSPEQGTSRVNSYSNCFCMCLCLSGLRLNVSHSRAVFWPKLMGLLPRFWAESSTMGPRQQLALGTSIQVIHPPHTFRTLFYCAYFTAVKSVILFSGAVEGTINPKTTQQEEATQIKLIVAGQSFFSALIVPKSLFAFYTCTALVMVNTVTALSQLLN